MQKSIFAIIAFFLVSIVHLQNSAAEAAQETKPEIIKDKEGLVIRGDNAVYLYIYKSKEVNFLVPALLNGKKAIFRAVLDKENKPVALFVMLVSKDGSIIQTTIAKDKGSQALYDKLEQLVAKFVAKYDVKKILRENGVK